MHCIGLFAVSPVQDLAAALEWYARLFGRAADDPAGRVVLDYVRLNLEARRPASGA